MYKYIYISKKYIFRRIFILIAFKNAFKNCNINNVITLINAFLSQFIQK